ncbi:MAG: hypothetical protein H6714_00635 [Myxococcales bacterium]|nr:hypothetical protein [Myxococcales bacterium]
MRELLYQKGKHTTVKAASFKTRTFTTLLATLLLYIPLSSCAPGSEGGVGTEANATRPMGARDILRLSCTEAFEQDSDKAQRCRNAVDPMFDALQPDAPGNPFSSLGAAIDFLRVDDRELVVEAGRFFAERTVQGTDLLDVALSKTLKLGWRNAVAKEFASFMTRFLANEPISQNFYRDLFKTLTGTVNDTDAVAAVEVKSVLAQYELPVVAASPSDAAGSAAAGAPPQLQGLAPLETAQAGAGLGGYAGAEQSFILVLLLMVIAVIALVSCSVEGGVTSMSSSSGGPPVDLTGNGTGINGTPLPTPQAGTVLGSNSTGAYSATPQFDPSNGRIVPIGGWGNTINQRWQRAAGGRANPDRGGETEWGLAAIEDLFETAPDGFTYNTVYQPFSDTSLPWLGFNTPNAFVDIPGSPKLGPYNPEQREVAFTVESVQVTATVFWFVVSSENGRASMLTDILGDEQGANNPLRYRSGTFPLAVFTSLPSGGATASYGIVVGPTDGRVGFRFVDVSTEDGMPGPSAPTTVNGIAAQRLGAGVASDGVSKLTAQPYAIVTSPEGSAPAGEFAIGFGYVDGQTRATPTYDFHVTFEAY